MCSNSERRMYFHCSLRRKWAFHIEKRRHSFIYFSDQCFAHTTSGREYHFVKQFYLFVRVSTSHCQNSPPLSLLRYCCSLHSFCFAIFCQLGSFACMAAPSGKMGLTGSSTFFKESLSLFGDVPPQSISGILFRLNSNLSTTDLILNGFALSICLAIC